MKRFFAPFKKLGLSEPLAIGGAFLFLGGVALVFVPAALMLGGALAMAYAGFLESGR
jgi:hypothetical protein